MDYSQNLDHGKFRSRLKTRALVLHGTKTMVLQRAQSHVQTQSLRSIWIIVKTMVTRNSEPGSKQPPCSTWIIDKLWFHKVQSHVQSQRLENIRLIAKTMVAQSL